MAMFLIIFTILGIMLGLYIVLMLLIAVKPKAREMMVNGEVTELKNIGNTSLPKLETYEARDGEPLEYRYYSTEASTNQTIILLHSAFETGVYLHKLALSIAQRGLARVYVPNLRGYGYGEQQKDVQYIGQIDDDLSDFIEFIQDQHLETSIIMAGHGLGGSTAMRFASNSYADQVNKFILLAPALAPNAPTSRHGGELLNGYASLSTSRQLGLMILNMLQIHKYNHLPVYLNNKPADLRSENEKDVLSFRMYLSRLANWQYEFDLRALKKPSLVLVGEKDERYAAKEYKPLFTRFNKAKVIVLPDVSHYGITSSESTIDEIEKWLLS